jgi:hypothetical protein
VHVVMNFQEPTTTLPTQLLRKHVKHEVFSAMIENGFMLSIKLWLGLHLGSYGSCLSQCFYTMRLPMSIYSLIESGSS